MLRGVLSLGAAVAEASDGYDPLAPRVFEPLPLGSIAPDGWLLDQLVRQASTLSGYLSSTQDLGGYHGDSNVVNMTKWLGGRGGGPSYISSNDQWFPYWANGNVPLVSLLRAAGALGRLPADLPLDAIIDSSMKYVIDHAEPAAGFDFIAGALAAGGDIGQMNCTVADAERHCTSNPDCLGFTYHGKPNSTAIQDVYFKSQVNSNTDGNWSSFTKRTGWLSGHLLSEGGTQIVMSLTQWAEDRSASDRKDVARVVVAHLLAVAACISPDTVQSWAATRWASVNTLFNYVLDRILPDFGQDPDVVPFGLRNTTDTLLAGAHRMGRVGFDYAAYYGGEPNPRSANKSVPNGSVPVWNVYDHGVNNAEGALRWPSEVYRLNGSLAEGRAAMRMLTSQLDRYQAQVQGTMCADECFCGRDPERGTETCTVVEMMASYEHSFATLGVLELMDRVERLAFNALPAALTGDMWTHVYVQQANSVYAGVTHPNASAASMHDEVEQHTEPFCLGTDTEGSCKDTDGGGPAAFSEIQKVNYFGTSHFPCCITNFPQGWPKFAQSTVLWQANPAAIVIASLMPLRATVAQANFASIHIDTAYPFGDSARVVVAATVETTVSVRIPSWAVHATIDGKPAPNGTLVPTVCPPGNTTIAVDLAPLVRVEQGWGDTLKTPANLVAVTRGPLVFALHPTENKTIVRNYSTVPANVGENAPDYVISTADIWNYALDLESKATFVKGSSAGWSLGFPFSETEYPFAINVTARQVPAWGYWKGSKITDPPPASPACSSASNGTCGSPTTLRLVPFGSTNIRISAFPYA